MYESWFVRLVSPDRPLAFWIRYTIDKTPGREATGTVWFTGFDDANDRPLARRLTGQPAGVPSGGWVRIGDSEIGPTGLRGDCFEAAWELRFAARAPALFHLSRPRLYDLPLPRTKPVTPVPLGDFHGSVRIGEREVSVDGWSGVIGHNWGTEHAERWIWLHGSGFPDDLDAWVDVAMGRVRVAGRLLPWVANGAIHSAGRTRRIGGMLARGLQVNESAARLEARLPVEGKASLDLEVESPKRLTVGWQYGDPADPDGESREVANCSAARMTASLNSPQGRTVLSTLGGAVYELGMSETGHGIPIASGLPPPGPPDDSPE